MLREILGFMELGAVIYYTGPPMTWTTDNEGMDQTGQQGSSEPEAQQVRNHPNGCAMILLTATVSYRPR